MANTKFNNLGPKNYTKAVFKPTSEISDRACIRCHERKVKCSMQLPTCKTCFKYNKDCSYARKVSKLYKCKDEIKSMLNRLDIEKIQKAALYTKGLKLSGTARPDFPVLEILIKNPLAGVIMQLVSVKFDVENLELNLMIKKLLSSSDRLFKVHGTHRTVHDYPFVIPGPFEEYGDSKLYYKAIDAYFKSCNLFTPLFTQKSFFQFKRSRLLNLLIYKVGAQTLGLDKEVLNWFPCATDEINRLAKNIFFKPCLDTIQTLAVIFNFSGNMNPIIQTSTLLITNMITQLGLHIDLSKSKRMHKELKYERYMALVTLTSIMLKLTNTKIDNFKIQVYSIPLASLDELDLKQLPSQSFLSELKQAYQDLESLELDCIWITIHSHLTYASTIKSLLGVKFAIQSQQVTSGAIANSLTKYRNKVTLNFVSILKLLSWFKIKGSRYGNMDKEMVNLYDNLFSFVNLLFFVTLHRIDDLDLYVNSDPNRFPTTFPIRTLNPNNQPAPPKTYHQFKVIRCVDNLIRIVNICIGFGFDAQNKPSSKGYYFLIVALNHLHTYSKLNPQLKNLNLVIHKGTAFLKSLGKKKSIYNSPEFPWRHF